MRVSSKQILFTHHVKMLSIALKGNGIPILVQQTQEVLDLEKTNVKRVPLTVQ